MKHIPRLLTVCLLICGIGGAALRAQDSRAIQTQDAETKAYEGKFYQCKDDGTFSLSAATSVAGGDVFNGREVSSHVKVLTKPEAKFTKEARRAQSSGTVRLQMVAMPDGKIADVTVLKGLSHGLTESAIGAACRVQFTPAIKDERAVAQRLFMLYNFNYKQQFPLH